MRKLVVPSLPCSAAAVAAVLLGFGMIAVAQAPSAKVPQIAIPPVTATTFNPLSDKLDRSWEGPVMRPMIVEIADNTYFINEFGMDSQYLVVGAKRALLIDTGSGFYDLKGTVEKLTKLPYDVAVTHGHPDHAGGVGEFDTVYMDPADIPMLKRITQHGEAVYGEIMWNTRIGYHGVWGYTPADAKWGQWDKHPVIKSLHDGQIFDLGGRRVTVYHIPGHTPGECVFIDDQSRILFSGDAANRNISANATPVSTLLRGLIRLQKLRVDGTYHRQYTGHVAYGGIVDVLPQDPKVLDDDIEAFREVLRGDAHLETTQNHLRPQLTQTVAVYGAATVGFDPKRLWEPGEQHVVP